MFSWRVGKVAGIDFYLHWTFLLFLLVVGLSWGGVGALALLVALFACVALHELGHALMARAFGVETRDITLYPIGGIARLERMPRAPGAELMIALAGPAVNFALAAALSLALALGGPVLGLSAGGATLRAFLDQVVWMNLLLGGFNLLPAFPMDGGRVLRALLSGPLGRLRATELSAMIGQGLAVIFGVGSLFFGSLPQVVLAAFVYYAAGAEASHVRAEEWHERTDRRLWTTPPGYRWVHRGDGVWHLVPIIVEASTGRGRPWA